MQLGFNPSPSTVMHLDINSCFATIEQQANPFLRGKPVGVAAYQTDKGIILAASVEAKRLGVKTAMPIFEAKRICPQIVVIKPDPPKYRHVHQTIRSILYHYTNEVTPKSIDEFTLHLEQYPALKIGLQQTAKEIKQRIKEQVGTWVTVSIGLGPNRFLAKTASDLEKPDGLQEINATNYEAVYRKLKLTDLHGINLKNEIRLRRAGIHSVLDMYQATIPELKSAFKSILSYYWYLRLRGWEIDQVEFARKSFGNQYSIPKPYSTKAELTPILTKLIEKTCSRLRRKGYYAQGIHLLITYRDGTAWHQSRKTKRLLISTQDMYQQVMTLFETCPYRKPVRLLSVSCFNLVPQDPLQLDLFGITDRDSRLTRAVDRVNNHWGEYTLTSARMLFSSGKEAVPDHIGFGNVKELPDPMNDLIQEVSA